MGRSLGASTAICALILLVFDLVAVAAAGLLSSKCFAAVSSAWWSSDVVEYWPVWRATAAVFWIAILYLAARGRYSERIPFWTEARLVVNACLYASVAALMFGLLTDDMAISVVGVGAVPVFGVLAVSGNRMAKRLIAHTSLWEFRVAVIGTGANAADAQAALEADRSLGYRFVGQFDPADIVASGDPAPLRSILNRYKARCLLIAFDNDGEIQRKIIANATKERIAFYLLPPPHTLPACQWEPMPLFGHGTMIVSPWGRQSRPMTRLAKTAIDIVVAALLLLITAPLFLALSIVSQLDKGPIFFAHRRIGADGRPFLCLKFRTMVVDGDKVLAAHLANNPEAAAEWAATRKLRNDPRVTPIGRFLRKTSLDELPQLVNILRLEMSLVGPRPIVESEIAYYGENIGHYYAARPGLTGPWQVSGRSDTSYARRVELDVWYVNNWTIWNDIALMLKTIPAVVGGQGAR
jgi:Undecaprenyl-phosphate galactose phosphotransferase WbaP